MIVQLLRQFLCEFYVTSMRDYCVISQVDIPGWSQLLNTAKQKYTHVTVTRSKCQIQTFFSDTFGMVYFKYFIQFVITFLAFLYV